MNAKSHHLTRHHARSNTCVCCANMAVMESVLALYSEISLSSSASASACRRKCSTKHVCVVFWRPSS